MKKILSILVMLIFTIMAFASCGNMDMFDTVYTYDRAIISLPTGEIIEGAVEQWCTYEDGDQIQVQINGKTYLVHSSDVVLIAE